MFSKEKEDFLHSHHLTYVTKLSCKCRKKKETKIKKKIEKKNKIK